MNQQNIPILRAGTTYESLDKMELTDHRSGQPVTSVSMANAGLIRRDARQAKQSHAALRQLPTERILDISKLAGELFLNEKLPVSAKDKTQSPEDYIESLSATTGLPHTLCRLNMKKIYQVFTEMPTILEGLTREIDNRVLDEGIIERSGIPLCFFPVTQTLGIVLPSNSPGVNTLWMPAIALKIPVVLKPGREEPWTPCRIIQAFLAAGCPATAFSFYPTDHQGADAIMDTCERSLIFGDKNTIKRYANNPAVQVHGPGRSKVLVGEDQIDSWDDYVDILVKSVLDNGGRSCINTSAIIVPSHGDQIAEALAERLGQIEAYPTTHNNAALAGFANPKVAEVIDQMINEGLTQNGATDITGAHREGTRLVTVEGSTYLLPTVIRCKSFEHPLANQEFLFPYTSVVEIPQNQMLGQIGPSLVVTAITENRSFIEQLLSSPFIDRLNLGPIPTTEVEWPRA